MKSTDGATHPNYCEVFISLLCQLCSTRYTAEHESKTVWKAPTYVIKVATMKKYGDFSKETIVCNHQINTFHSQQRWMEHKGGHW